VPSLFKRRSAEAVEPAELVEPAEPAERAQTGSTRPAEPVDLAKPAKGAGPGRPAEPADAAAGPDPRARAHTPSKRELGKATPKRRDTARRRPPEPPLSRKEANKRARERARAEREERRAGMLRGDERYLLPRDRGPVRALVRDIVDSRPTVGTWFFAGALIVLIGSSRAMPPIVQLVSNGLWMVLAVGTLLDSLIIARQINRLVRQRFPKTDERMGSLYMYGIMRALMIRRLRMPKPRVKWGERI
jgi:hypothetical protein